MKVFIVDDSVVFRTQIKSALLEMPGIEVVGTASNGKIALDKLKSTDVDLVTLDMEMPELNGLETLKQLRANGLIPKVIVFASATARGAEMALEALKLGAIDFIAKPKSDVFSIEGAREQIKKDLLPKILQFAPPPSTEKPNLVQNRKVSLGSLKPEAVLIGSSTGGPMALEALFEQVKWPNSFCPIFIVQHMPSGGFTTSLSQRLARISGVPVSEATQWGSVQPGHAYMAPGDHHMRVVRENNKLNIKIDQTALVNNVRPAVDILLNSAASIWGDKCLTLILTGMGNDGLEGVKSLKKLGAGVAIQNRESCVVFGMPGAVFYSGCYDMIGNIPELAKLLTGILENSAPSSVAA